MLDVYSILPTFSHSENYLESLSFHLIISKRGTMECYSDLILNEIFPQPSSFISPPCYPLPSSYIKNKFYVNKIFNFPQLQMELIGWISAPELFQIPIVQVPTGARWRCSWRCRSTFQRTVSWTVSSQPVSSLSAAIRSWPPAAESLRPGNISGSLYLIMGGLGNFKGRFAE